MLRAATTGMMDYSRFDPWDAWWWRKLDWVLEELASVQNREAFEIQHEHWVTLASKGNLLPESFTTTQQNASTALNKWLKETYPWMADQIGDAGTQSGRDAAVAAYNAEFGKPGEERYEKMIAEVGAYLRRGRLTPRQKEQERKQRREHRARELAAAAGNT